MAYTHSTKCGNPGDIAKHPLLPRLVQHLSEENASSLFLYADTHTARPTYVLERNGEWEHGIGEFYNRLQSLSNVSTDFPNLKPYLDLCLNEPPRPGSEYPGSSGLVFRMLKGLGETVSLLLV